MHGMQKKGQKNCTSWCQETKQAQRTLIITWNALGWIMSNDGEVIKNKWILSSEPFWNRLQVGQKHLTEYTGPGYRPRILSRSLANKVVGTRRRSTARSLMLERWLDIYKEGDGLWEIYFCCPKWDKYELGSAAGSVFSGSDCCLILVPNCSLYLTLGGSIHVSSGHMLNKWGTVSRLELGGFSEHTVIMFWV